MFFLQILLHSLVVGTQVVLLAVPLYLVYSSSKIFHLGLGATGISVAYALWFALKSGWSLPMAIIFALICAIVLGILSFALLEKLAKKKEHLFGLLVSFSFGLCLEAIVAIMFGTDGKFFLTTPLPTIRFSELYLTFPGVATLIAGVILSVLFLIIVAKTPWGRKMKAVSENSYLLASLSFNAGTVRLFVLIIASVLAGFVGIMTTLNSNLTPNAGFSVIVLAFIALLVGGVNSLKGTILASYIVVLIPELIVGLSSGQYSISLSWKMVIVFVVAAIFLTWKPNGLLTRKARVE
ncbi:MAG: Inner-membrane translocator [Parcubacteria group bacterium GW2011_GWC2_38_7]|nr:MAG: Inner-membrane translocator [Parcubacteria group bacterium GW2011_GWC2_38_7]